MRFVSSLFGRVQGSIAPVPFAVGACVGFALVLMRLVYPPELTLPLGETAVWGGMTFIVAMNMKDEQCPRTFREDLRVASSAALPVAVITFSFVGLTWLMM